MKRWINPSAHAAVALLILLLSACANPAADAPEAEVSEPAPVTSEPPAAPALPAGTTYALGEGSAIGFVGSKITGSHEGGFAIFSGEVVLVDNDPTASRVSLEIDTTSLWADNDKLAGHLKSDDFFGVEAHPTASFSSTEITANEDGTYTMTGMLDLHGVSKQIAFPASIEIGEDGVSARAEFAIKRFDFGIAYAGKADDLIRDDVLIKLDLKGIAG